MANIKNIMDKHGNIISPYTIPDAITMDSGKNLETEWENIVTIKNEMQVINTYQTKTDENLITHSKNISGAINELLERIIALENK